MTLAMVAMHRVLPRRQQYRLPPRQVTMSILSSKVAKRELEEPERANATLVSHFAYGAACGALYAPLASRLRPPGAGAGVAHGLAVWTVSYLGLLPALRILEPATRHPAERNLLMIAAHVVWGATAGALVERMLKEEEQVGQASGHINPQSTMRPQTEPIVEIH
jgi:uncharacterized membrane protein YagU involved in acid resistance